MNPDLELLLPPGADQRFERWRGRRPGAAAPVLLKRARRTPPAPGDREALQRECAVAAGLSSASTLLPRLVESDAAATLVMEDPGGELLSNLGGNVRLDIEAWLALATQLALSLAELHQRGLLHNGVRPEIILWNARAQHAWLIDFADAGPPSSRPAAPVGAAGAAPRLVYISPEQTGRMDRCPDPRSDLYSLGVVLYELLAGAPPGRCDDALAQIHWHIAGVPRALQDVTPGVPALLSDLVMKLLAKTPEERYQSANGLAQDLALCARDWSAQRSIAPFPLGRRDSGAGLVISPRLYGREREVHTLLECFERVCLGQGGRTLVLVEGYSGVGKTALIQQLYRPIVRQQGYFISGKFDQVVRGVPFGALIQAFRGLVRQLLTESEARLAAWRETLLLALGSNGGVLAAVIPEIEFIVGPQPVPAELPGTEAQNRFQRVLQNFVAALATPEHPLVLFLDDLQWADAATLGLLEPLLTGGEARCLMLMGAYRDNELDASPRLANTLAALASAGVDLKRISLGPLHLAHVARLVADTLNSNALQATPLAQLVQAKTGGNPFFVIQFLKSLERDGHLHFDVSEARWVYRIEQIADAPLADNVIELMTRSIQRLPPKSQYALTLAACIGNRFDLQTLALVSEQSIAQTAADLEQASAEGLIVSAGRRFGDAHDSGAADTQVFAFLHDRVQQSAYAMIPAERSAMVHLTVGRLLRSRARQDEIETSAFDIVHHLNLGRGLIQEAAERREVAALNLAAGRRAKASTAHDSALELFLAGCGLLETSAWTQDYELCFELHLEGAESLYLCGQFDAALRALGELAGQARSAIDHARVMRLRSVQFENMARYGEALASTREGLAPFGVAFPDAESDKALALEAEIRHIEALRGERTIASLIDLPAMSDAQIRIVMAMLTDIWSAAFIIGDPTLARLISATMVRLSLVHGNAPESAYGYVTHAITVGPVRGEYLAAYEFGRLALEVNRRFDDARRRAKIYQQFHAHVNLWCQPLRTCMAYAREACRSGLDSGDFLYAAYAAGTEPWSAIVATQDLAQFVRDCAPNVALIDKLKNTGFADSVRVILNWARALQGLTHAPLSLSDATLDEDAYLSTYREHPFFGTIHAVARLHLCSLLGSPQQALQAAQHSASLVHNVPGTIWPVIHAFWAALAWAANVDSAPEPQRTQWLARIQQAQSMFEVLARHNAENFQCQAWLLGAELARIDGRERDALELVERTIEFAAGGPMLQYQALAHELLAQLRAQLGQSHLANLHWALARDAYAQWGAHAKVQALESQHPAQPQRPAAVPANGVPVAAAEPAPERHPAVDEADGFDLFSVLKAAQAIAAEVELDALLARLMHIAIENAGAERGALVLEGDTGAIVHATPASAEVPLRTEPGVALEHAHSVPIGIVNYVRRTAQALVLANAETDEEHGSDPYVQRCRPRSVVCMPVHKQGRAIGVLYLEHCRASAVFTPPRLRTLRILAAQAAISLDNARLIAALKQENAERRQAQEQLGTALAEVERLKEDLEAENSYLRRDMIANVSHDLRTPLVSMRGYLEVMAAKGDSLDPQLRQQYLGIAVRQTEHLGTLIDELFELAKLDFKGMTLEREAFSFAELAADVVQKFELTALDRQVRLRVAAPPHLPFVEADLSLMERVLENLIGNALKHTPAGGQVDVCVSVSASGDRLLAEVADTGKGIPGAELPFIFDRFYRGINGRSFGGGGAGLGLAITKRIVELHHGDIRVGSDGCSGTRFSVSLPLPDGSRLTQSPTGS